MNRPSPADGSSSRKSPAEPQPSFAFARILLPSRIGRALDYAVPKPLADRIRIGMRVSVPFRNKTVSGIVAELTDRPEVSKTRPILDLPDEEPVIDESLLRLTRRMADYYLCGWTTALRSAWPPAFEDSPKTLYRLTEKGRAARSTSVRLPKNQEAVLSALSRSSAGGRHGLTARSLSGRPPARSATPALMSLIRKGLVEKHIERRRPKASPEPRIILPGERHPQHRLPLDFEKNYDRSGTISSRRGYRVFSLPGALPEQSAPHIAAAVDALLEDGKQLLVLAPEVTEAETLAEKIAGLLHRPAALYHGDLPPSIRKATWEAIADGRVSVVIGTRSAVLAPLKSLGLIIVVQEEDPAYKAEEAPHYHARDVALMRAVQLEIPVVLTSLAPSVESYAKSKTGEYQVLEGGARRRHPTVTVEDVNSLKPGQVLSPRLTEAIESRIRRKQSVLLLLNRRGFSTALLCRDCGHIFRCHRCGVTLIFHRGVHRLICHYCGSRQTPPTVCPSCKGVRLEGIGTGTERLEETLRHRYPDGRILRIDRDTGMAARKKADIYIGTEWIYRWTSLPPVHLVAVLDADTYLHIPDYHASERMFHFIALVVYKVGSARTSRFPAEVIIQTKFPEHYSVRWVRDGKIDHFYEAELTERKALGYPPYSRLVAVTVASENSSGASGWARALGQRLAQAAAKNNFQVMGPVPAPITPLRGKHRFLLLLKGPADDGTFQESLRSLLGPELENRRRDATLTVVVDPLRIQ